MTYDLTCYKPVSKKPNLDEAELILHAGYQYVAGEVPDPEVKWKIAAALMKSDSRLEPSKLDRAKVAENTFAAEEKANVVGIELNNFAADISIQLEISDDRVSMTIPFWFDATDADRVFETVSRYLRLIRRTAGFFVYDPQVPDAFDPTGIISGERHVREARETYLGTMGRMPEIQRKIAEEGTTRKSEEGEP